MFCTGNENYMQDLYFNQMPNPGFNPYMTNGMNSNSMVGMNTNNIPMNTNTMSMNMGINNDASMNSMFMPNQNMMVDTNRNMMQNTQMSYQATTQNPNIQNPNHLFPSIYRIINPVVNRVVSGNTSQFLTEDSLNNMVDTVYNIVEGQIELEDEPVNTNSGATERSSSSNTMNSTSSNNSRSTSTSNTNEMRSSSNSNSTTTNISSNSSSSSLRRNRDNSLLRDLIRILILKELLSRNQICMNRGQFLNQNYMMQQPAFFQGNM